MLARVGRLCQEYANLRGYHTGRSVLFFRHLESWFEVIVVEVNFCEELAWFEEKVEAAQRSKLPAIVKRSREEILTVKLQGSLRWLALVLSRKVCSL